MKTMIEIKREYGDMEELDTKTKTGMTAMLRPLFPRSIGNNVNFATTHFFSLTFNAPYLPICHYHAHTFIAFAMTPTPFLPFPFEIFDVVINGIFVQCRLGFLDIC